MTRANTEVRSMSFWGADTVDAAVSDQAFNGIKTETNLKYDGWLKLNSRDIEVVFVSQSESAHTYYDEKVRRYRTMVSFTIILTFRLLPL